MIPYRDELVFILIQETDQGTYVVHVNMTKPSDIETQVNRHQSNVPQSAGRRFDGSGMREGRRGSGLRTFRLQPNRSSRSLSQLNDGQKCQQKLTCLEVAGFPRVKICEQKIGLQ